MPDPEWRFGLEIDRGYDAGGYRRKEACLAVTDCPVCGRVRLRRRKSRRREVAVSDIREVDLGYDAEGYQRKSATYSVPVQCPVCGKDLFLEMDTESWTEGEGGRWEHDQYGPAEAICCGRLVVDTWDGCYVYRLAEDQPRG